MKTDFFKFKRKLETTNKTFFTMRDIKKFYAGEKESLKVLLSNWVKKGLIYNLGHGYYAFDIASVDYLSLATVIDPNSYVSFEYALFYHGLIDQVPSVITLASKKRSRKINMGSWVFEYSHLKNELFFSYELKNKVYIASPEKALADLIYLISRGKRMAELDTLDMGKLNKTKLKFILKKFPGYVSGKANEFILVR